MNKPTVMTVDGEVVIVEADRENNRLRKIAIDCRHWQGARRDCKRGGGRGVL